MAERARVNTFHSARDACLLLHESCDFVICHHPGSNLRMLVPALPPITFWPLSNCYSVSWKLLLVAYVQKTWNVGIIHSDESSPGKGLITLQRSGCSWYKTWWKPEKNGGHWCPDVIQRNKATYCWHVNINAVLTLEASHFLSSCLMAAIPSSYSAISLRLFLCLGPKFHQQFHVILKLSYFVALI